MTDAATEGPLFDTVVIIGVGLIGSSLALNIREKGLARRVVGVSRSAENRAKILALGLADGEAVGALDGAGHRSIPQVFNSDWRTFFARSPFPSTHADPPCESVPSQSDSASQSEEGRVTFSESVILVCV